MGLVRTPASTHTALTLSAHSASGDGSLLANSLLASPLRPLPPTPPHAADYKQEAIRGLGMGTEDRVAMLFDEVMRLYWGSWGAARSGCCLAWQRTKGPP